MTIIPLLSVVFLAFDAFLSLRAGFRVWDVSRDKWLMVVLTAFFVSGALFYDSFTFCALFFYWKARQKMLGFSILPRIRSDMSLFQKSEKQIWGLEALEVILLWLAGLTLIKVLLDVAMLVFYAWYSELGETLMGTVFSSAWLWYLVYRASKKFSDNGFWYNVGFRPPDLPLSVITFLGWSTGTFFAFVSTLMILFREAQPETPLSQMMNATDPGSAWMIVFMVLAIFTAPLYEEVVFRGYFFQVLKSVKGKAWAVILVSLSFAGLHVPQYWGDWAAIIVVTFLGFGLTLFRLFSKTTASSVAMHYAYNLGVVLVPFILVVLGVVPLELIEQKMGVTAPEAVFVFRIR